MQEWDAEDGAWRTLATVKPDEQGQARWVWRPGRLGRHRLRAVLAASDVVARRRSAACAACASTIAATAYRVPSSYPHLIVVDLSQYRLYYYEHGRVVRAFDCVLGRPSLPTPRGHFKIYAKDPAHVRRRTARAACAIWACTPSTGPTSPGC